jgi:hypothetical protein
LFLRGPQFKGKHAACETFFTVEHWRTDNNGKKRARSPQPLAESCPQVDVLLTFLKASRNVFPFLDQFCLGPLVTFEFLRLALGLFRTDKIL